MFRVGTDEAFIGEDIKKMADELGISSRAMHWRKPLSIVEINRLAQTPEVIERRGRP